MKKRVLALFLSAVMALSLSACAKEPTLTKLGDYKDVTSIMKAYNDDNVQAYFDQLMSEAGIAYLEVTDRDVVQAGDVVATDYTGYIKDVAFVGGSTIQNGTSNPQYIDVDNNGTINIKTGELAGAFIDNFTDGLIGAKKNEDKSGKVKFPDGYGQTTLVDDDDDDTNNKKVTLDNQEVTFVFNVKSIYVKTTPENLTDALVAEKFTESLGVKTVDELMAYLKEDAPKQVFQSYFANIVYSMGVSAVKVKDRDTVQAGDVVKVDYTGYYDGVAFKNGSATGQYVEIDSNCTIDISTGEVGSTLQEGFAEALKGAKIDTEGSMEITLSSKYGETALVDSDTDSSNDVKVDLSGKKVTYKYTVKEIYVVVTPESVTDAIVKEYFADAYDVTTAKDFVKAVRGELGFNWVVSSAIENSTFDISDGYVEKRVDEYQEVFEALYCTGYDIETILSAYYGATLDQARAEWAETIKQQIKAELVFAAIFEAEGLKIDEEELAEYVESVQDSAEEEGGNAYFKEEENIYKMMGSGNAEKGKQYWLHQSAVRSYLMKVCADAQAE